METTRDNLAELIKVITEQYVSELERLPFKLQVRQALTDGFRDGVRSGVFQAVSMLGVTILEMETESNVEDQEADERS